MKMDTEADRNIFYEAVYYFVLIIESGHYDCKMLKSLLYMYRGLEYVLIIKDSLRSNYFLTLNKVVVIIIIIMIQNYYIL